MLNNLLSTSEQKTRESSLSRHLTWKTSTSPLRFVCQSEIEYRHGHNCMYIVVDLQHRLQPRVPKKQLSGFCPDNLQGRFCGRAKEHAA